MKTSPLSPEIISKYIHISEEADRLFDEITERIDYIAECIYNELEPPIVSYVTWDYKLDALDADTNIRTLGKMLSNGWVAIQIDARTEEVLMTINKDGDEIDLCKDGFPASWLTEDFEEKLREGVCKSKNKHKVLDKTGELVESAKSKLTDEELKALRYYFKAHNTI